MIDPTELADLAETDMAARPTARASPQVFREPRPPLLYVHSEAPLNGASRPSLVTAGHVTQQTKTMSLEKTGLPPMSGRSLGSDTFQSLNFSEFR
jgi:hypothetical protein